MKTALITTSINIPTVLELYRCHGPEVAYFVAGDLKTPEDEIVSWAADKRFGGYLSPEMQTKLGYRCSDLIGWNCIQRRNIALLEALRWGADIIVSIDDDNIPVDRASGNPLNYFERFEDALQPFDGIKVSSANRWFDVGQLLDPVASHRGFPIAVDPTDWRIDPVTNTKVGVAAGICLGDPDISAVTRIANYPTVHRVSQLLEAGIVVDHRTRTVFNSQNTAFIRELAPAFFMPPFCGRYDDIYASLIMQRVMRERDLLVHFGKPFVWQSRNPHNLINDLRNEIGGMENIVAFANCLDGVSLEQGASVLEHVAQCYQELDNESALLPKQSVEAALAFLEDVEQVLE